MSANENNLIWIDLEMTGLDPERDRIIEIATLVTDANLNILAEGPTIAVHQSDEQLALMDDWNVRTHTGSGLVERVKASTMGDREAELATLAFLKEWVPEGNHLSVATASARIVVSCLNTCRSWRRISIIAIWTSARSKNWRVVGSRKSWLASPSRERIRRWTTFVNLLLSLLTIANILLSFDFVLRWLASPAF
jgi:hypothetical protein